MKMLLFLFPHLSFCSCKTYTCKRTVLLGRCYHKVIVTYALRCGRARNIHFSIRQSLFKKKRNQHIPTIQSFISAHIWKKEKTLKKWFNKNINSPFDSKNLIVFTDRHQADSSAIKLKIPFQTPSHSPILLKFSQKLLADGSHEDLKKKGFALISQQSFVQNLCSF